MTYLAFDPEHVAALAAAMARSLDELWSLRCDDPSAAGAMRTVRSVREELESQWLPLARRVADSPVLTRPADLGALSNSLAYVMAKGYGWSVTDDPGSVDVLTAEEARALGARLNTTDAADAVDDPAELRWLAARLERIAADPRLSAEFLANFHEWAPWGDALGRQRARIVAGIDARTSVTVADLDSVFAALAHVQRAVLPDLSDERAPTRFAWITEMHPYAAAAITRFLGLRGAALAAASDLILLQQPITGLDALDGPNAADTLFALMAGDDAAGSRFLTLASRHPEVLFARAADTGAAFRLVLQATDPAHMDPEVAGDVLPRVVRYFQTADIACDEQCYGGQARPDDWRGFLVDLVAPWMLQLSPYDSQWKLTNEERDRLLSFVLEDDTSLQRFVERADRVQHGFITSISSSTPPPLDELGAFMAMIGEIIVNNREQTLIVRRQGWEMITTLAGLLTAAIPGVAIAAGLSFGLVIISANTSPDPAGAVHRLGFGADLGSTVAGAAVAAQIAQQWKHDGDLPAGFPDPPTADPGAELPSQAFMDAFDEWRASLPGGEYGPLADHVTRHVYAVINPALMGAHSVTLFMP